jgi:hypothetical protein
MIGIHIREVSAYPWRRINGGPFPPVKKFSRTPSTSAERDSKVAGFAAAASARAAGATEHKRKRARIM